jgi:hypothetical protein
MVITSSAFCAVIACTMTGPRSVLMSPSSIRWVAAQRNASAALGVEAARIYGDHSLTGTNRERPGLREALAPAEPGTPTR